MKQYYKALTVYTPTNFDVTSIKGYNHRWHEKYLWFIHSILYESLTTKQDFSGYVNLQTSLLKKFLGDRYYKPIIEQLIQSNVIEQNQKYSSGAFSMSYRLKRKYRTSAMKGITIDKQTYCRKIAKHREEYLADLLRENLLTQYEFFMLTYARIDIQSAMDYIYLNYKENTPQFKNRIITLEQFHAMHKATFADGRYTNIGFTFKVNKGRIYSPVTMLPKDLEQFIYFDGYESESVVSADAMNSQLCFFNELLKRNNNATNCHHIGSSSREDDMSINDSINIGFESAPTPLNPSPIPSPYVVQNTIPWEDYIFNGLGYERMMFLCKWKGKEKDHTKQERTEFKEEFFGNLFYNRWRPELTYMERIFMQYHESEAIALRNEKKRLGNKLLAVEVQRLEARFFHTWIVDYMKTNHKNVPFIIKHDSIMLPACEASYIVPELNYLLRRFFKRNGMQLKVSVL